MCQEGFNPRMAPLTSAHAEFLKVRFPEDAALIDDLFQALTAGLNPHFNVLALLLMMARAKQDGSYGLAGTLWGEAVRFPLSVVTPENGVRHRTPLLGDLHASVLSLNMSQATMARVDRVLAKHDLAVQMMCSCGVLIMDRRLAANILDDPTLLDMDRYRSSLDGLGRPVVSVRQSHEIPVDNMDWTDEERSFHDTLDRLVQEMADTVPFDADTFIRERGLAPLAGQMLRNAEATRCPPLARAA